MTRHPHPPPASGTRAGGRGPEAIWPHWAQACPAQRDCPSGPSTSTWAVARARGGSWPLHADLASQNPHSHGPPQPGGGDPAGGVCPGHGLGSSFPVSAQGGECEEPPPALPRDASPLPPTWDGTGSLPLPAPPPTSTAWAAFPAWGAGLVRLGQSPALCATETPEGFGELGLQALAAVGMRGHGGAPGHRAVPSRGHLGPAVRTAVTLKEGLHPRGCGQVLLSLLPPRRTLPRRLAPGYPPEEPGHSRSPPGL